MARTISAPALVEVAKALGTEPIIIAQVTWGLNGPVGLYADRAYEVFTGKLIEVSGLDSIIKLQSTGATGSVSLIIDDTDGSIKTILNTSDVHKGTVEIFQTYGDIISTEKFLLLKGQINTPIVWDETSRTVKFDVVAFIEDKEIGFSPEEGEFDFIADSAVGVAWPLCFGKPLRVPAVKITEKVRGTSLTRYGLITLPNLKTLCDRSRTFSSATRQKDAADINPGFSDENYANVINNYSSTLESLTLYIESLVADSPSQESDIKLYSSKCQALEKSQANLTFYTSEALRYNAAVLANQSAIASLQAQIAQKSAEVPVPVSAIAALNTSLAQQQAELIQNQSGYNNAVSLVTAANSSITTLEAEIAALEVSIPVIVLTEIIVDGGEEFPQGSVVAIIVKGVRFTGTFSGRTFTIEEANLPFYAGLDISVGTNETEFFLTDATVDLKGKYCFFAGIGIVYCDNQVGTKCIISPILFEQTGQLPPLQGVLINGQPVIREIFDPRYLVTPITEASVILRPGWVSSLETLNIDFATGLSNLAEQDWTLEIGDEVYLDGDYRDVYIANLIPSISVFEVFAYRTINGVRTLFPVPSRYYAVNLSESIAGQTATTIRLVRPLLDYVDEGWEPQIYVSLESSVGDSTVDAISYLVDTYTPYAKDTATFTSVKTALTDYPSNFAILDRPSALATIENIAWQARCAAFLSNDVVKLRYLASDEAAELTLTEAMVENKTFELHYTETENLVTKFVAEWRTTLDKDKPNKLVYRNNIPKYGEVEQVYNFYIYNSKELVETGAFFWMLRYSNTWKRVICKVFLDSIELESFDPVSLSFTAGLISNAAVKGYVESAVYDSETFSITLTIWTSVRSGEMATYEFAFPASASLSEEYPTVNDLYAGGA